MIKIFENLFGNNRFEKTPFPEEYQVRIVLNEFKKQQLLDIINKYVLKANHLNLVGTAFRNLKEYTLAENAYKDAIQLSPEFDEPYGNLLSLYIFQKKYELCEEVYRKGMNNATKKSFIIYQDGRLQYAKGRFEVSLSAARNVLIAEEMMDEAAIVLAIQSLLSLIKQEKNVDKNCDNAFKLWNFGISVFPESQSLKALSEYFVDDE